MKIIQKVVNSGYHMGSLLSLKGVAGVYKDGRVVMNCDLLALGEKYASRNYCQIGDTIVEYENQLWGVIPKDEKETNVK